MYSTRTLGMRFGVFSRCFVLGGPCRCLSSKSGASGGGWIWESEKCVSAQN